MLTLASSLELTEMMSMLPDGRGGGSLRSSFSDAGQPIILPVRLPLCLANRRSNFEERAEVLSRTLLADSDLPGVRVSAPAA
jgi:hypothetical protein